MFTPNGDTPQPALGGRQTSAIRPGGDMKPIVLTLGPVTGLVLQQHYTRNFWGRRVLAWVDKKVAVALVDPPEVYAILAGSLVAHLMRPELLDEGEDRAGWEASGPAYRWRWRWRTRCGGAAIRVCSPIPVVVAPKPYVTLTASVGVGHRLCRRCGAALGRLADGAYEKEVPHGAEGERRRLAAIDADQARLDAALAAGDDLDVFQAGYETGYRLGWEHARQAGQAAGPRDFLTGQP